jgi:ABC-2 type transport system ATP-binding protein
MTAMIDFTHVAKRFGKTQALKDLTLQVPEGTIYGLLGRNGAGKSTTLQMIMRLLRPDSGTVQVMGKAPHSLSLADRQQIGYASDSLPLIPWFRIGELLAYNGAFYPGWDSAYVNKWMQQLAIDPQKRILGLSRGERQKVALLMAIGHRPRLLVLDEPAGGLDPVVRQEFLQSLIELLHETGTTIVISSHQMSDIERLVEYVGILEAGQMQLEASLDDLRGRIRQVQLWAPELTPDTRLKDAAIVEQSAHKGSLQLLHTQWDKGAEAELLARYPEASVQVTPLSLEEIFLLYQRQGVRA